MTLPHCTSVTQCGAMLKFKDSSSRHLICHADIFKEDKKIQCTNFKKHKKYIQKYTPIMVYMHTGKCYIIIRLIIHFYLIVFLTRIY